ncbi:hypothetical protein [Bacillus solimangrovi]|uniref:hypothetical protein n=1 Tax=Bacillus solimangrovi TaxID=1305675 RepID=UPI0009F51B20|nr:hypothetical protein [Bacillus solimangrovi]
MQLIVSQTYVNVVRMIENNVQQYIENEEVISLYSDRIITHTDEFYLMNVFDISYRSMASNSGFLYLHTNKGVFSYHVKSNPNRFINEFKKMK